MGVDCNIALPPNVELRNVASVIGMAAGLPCKKRSIGSKGYWSADVDGVTIGNTSTAEMAEISITAPFHRTLADGEIKHMVFYHFEGTSVKGGNRLLMPRSTAFWLAIGVKLVQFFGGAIMPMDCNGKWTYKVPAKSNRLNCPQSDDPWQNMQERIAAVKPITERLLQHYDQWAAYKLEDIRV